MPDSAIMSNSNMVTQEIEKNCMRVKKSVVVDMPDLIGDSH